MNYTKITQRSSSLGRRVRGAPRRPRASMLSQARKRKLRSVDRVGGQTRQHVLVRVREGPGPRRRWAARQRGARNVQRGVARPKVACIQSFSRVRKSWQRGTWSKEGASGAVDHDHLVTIGLLGRVAACCRPQVQTLLVSALFVTPRPLRSSATPLRTWTRPSSTCTCWSSLALHRELEVAAAAPLQSSVRPCTKGSMHGHRRAVTRMHTYTYASSTLSDLPEAPPRVCYRCIGGAQAHRTSAVARPSSATPLASLGSRVASAGVLRTQHVMYYMRSSTRHIWRAFPQFSAR